MKNNIPGSIGPTLPPALGRKFLAATALVAALLCGTGRAALAQDGERSVLQVKIDAAAEMLKHEKRLGEHSDQQRLEMIRFVAGNVLFVVLHEMGHVLITEMGLPVLGREEDAADSFASFAMLMMKNDFSNRVLTKAAQGWFYSDRRDRMENQPVVYYDAHSLSRQRAFQIVCYMVGSDPEKFATLAKEVGLPEDRQSTCQGDYSNIDWSWTKLLKPHERQSTDPKTTIEVVYGEPTERLALYAEMLKRTQLLETLAQRFSEKFVWRAPFKIEAKSCGAVGADWNIAERTLTFCYEMAQDFCFLYRSYSPAAMTMAAP